MVKLRVLCLHGYRQNKDTFRERTGALRKLLKKHVDFYFVAAPHVIPEPQNLQRPAEEQERGWWFSRPEKSYNALDETDCCIGFEDSVAFIRKVFEDAGPFDGVLGFSQGAAFVGLLDVVRRREPEGPVQFKFAILVAGFKSLLSSHSHYYDDDAAVPLLLGVPSFHTAGASDAVIAAKSSEELASLCPEAVVYRHDGGHYIPASAQLKAALLDFLAAFNT